MNQTRSSINWEALSKLFASEKATPAFYNLALNLISNKLSSEASAYKEITPLVTLYSNLEKELSGIVESYKSATTPSEQAMILRQIHNVNQVRNAVLKYIMDIYGISPQALAYNQQPWPNQPHTQALPQQPQSPPRKLELTEETAIPRVGYLY